MDFPWGMALGAVLIRGGVVRKQVDKHPLKTNPLHSTSTVMVFSPRFSALKTDFRRSEQLMLQTLKFVGSLFMPAILFSRIFLLFMSQA